MKILMICGFYPSETALNEGIFFHNQVKALRSLKSNGCDINVDVLLIDLRSFRKRRQYGYSEYYYDGLRISRYAYPCGPIPLLDDFLGRIAAKKGLEEYIERHGKPDILHSHFFGTTWQCYRLKKSYNIPFVVTEHSSGIMNMKWNKFSKEKYSMVYNEADLLISVSEALKNKILEITKKDIAVVPNVIPNFFFEKSKGEKNKDETVFRFISVGALVDIKRFDLTIKAFRNFNLKYKNSELIIVGKGPLLKKLRKLVEKYNLTNHAKFIGQIPNRDLPAYYQSAHCFVLPSDSETFGVVYAEAAAVGIPIIATRCGGAEEIVNEKNGILVPVNDEKALCDAMIYVYNNQNLFDKDIISEEIQNKYGEKSVALRQYSLYEDVLNGAGI